nr:helitron helicase-like domain-containing protein [Tanacetum cinerariifolium]
MLHSNVAGRESCDTDTSPNSISGPKNPMGATSDQPTRTKRNQSYVGRIVQISNLMVLGEVTRKRVVRRTIGIQNLDHDTIGFTMWNDMATEFNTQEYEEMENPVVIAVSSCWVTKYTGVAFFLMLYVIADNCFCCFAYVLTLKCFHFCVLSSTLLPTYFRAVFLFIIMKTKRKLVPKDVVMGNIGEPRIVATRDSCLGHVGEGSQSFLAADSDLGCLVGGCFNGGQAGNISQVGLCFPINMVDNVNPTLHVHGFSRTDDAEVSGTQLNETQKRNRDRTTTSGNVDRSDRSLSKRQHISVDHGNPYLATLDANFVLVGQPVLNVGNSFGVHVSSESNLTHESFASSYINQKLTRDVLSRTTTLNVGSSFTPIRRRVSSGHHSLNTSTFNDDPVFPWILLTCIQMPLVLHCSINILENARTLASIVVPIFGARVDDLINIGRGPYVFKILGQLYHWLGSLCPAEGESPRFLQLYVYDTENELYVYDTENEVNNRISHYGGDNSDLCRDIVEGLVELLDNHNALVQLFRTTREKLLDSEIPPFKVRLFSVVGAREYELPTRDTLGEIVYEPGPDTDMDFDIIIEHHIGLPQRVNKLHPFYMALQFPLLFVYGEDRYSKDMKMVRVPGASLMKIGVWR